MSPGDDACGGCGQEPHPTVPCSEAAALRRSARKPGTLYVVWIWWPKSGPCAEVYSAHTQRAIALEVAKARRHSGWRVKIVKTQVQP